MRIDVFTHILTPRYLARVFEILDRRGDTVSSEYRAMSSLDPSLTDLEARFRLIDEVAGGDDYRQVLVMGHTQAEHGEPDEAAALAAIGNEELAATAADHPDRFVGWVAQVALQDGERGLKALEEQIEGRGALGAQVFTHIQGRCLDHPDYEPFFELMARLDRPIWIHPNRTIEWSDFPLTEDGSRYHLYSYAGWPTDTTVTMYRLMAAGYLERWPHLRIITHHSGGTVPMIAGRLKRPMDWHHQEPRIPLTREPLDYLRRFYADTANFGNPIALRAALDFFGEDNVLFGSDFGYSPTFLPQTLEDIEAVVEDERVKRKVYEDNARRVLRLAESRFEKAAAAAR
ncbi:MAG TPA: amidohydrolase family protein [Capillimicrobium sp.]|nr:amidohydrolase family protein [Capillimicrobium sp.]